MPQVLKHVVIWTLHKPQDASQFKELLDSCAQLVPGTLSFDVGIRSAGLEANADVVLVSAFASREALDAYLHHPHHKEVSAQLGPMRLQRAVVDYWSPSGAE
ncbi:MAG: Dabb family protein [Rhizobacter sp.]